MANIYNFNKQLYPNVLHDEINIGLGFDPLFIDYNVINFDIAIYFESPLSGGEEIALSGIVASNIYVDTGATSSFYSVDTTILDSSSITTGSLLSNSLTSNTINSTSLITSNLTATTLFSGSTNISDIFANKIHTHVVSAITDIDQFYLKIEEDFITNIVRVGKGGNVDFNTITDAINSITAASTFNPYVIQVGSGIYVEDNITMKSGISIVANTLGSVIIAPTASANTIFIGADGSSINNLILSSANGVGGKAIYHTGAGGTGFLVRDCNFNDNYINIHSYGLSARTVVYVDRCSVTGNNTKSFLVENTGSTVSQVIFTNGTYNDLITPVTETFFSISGVNSTVTLTNTTLRTSGDTGSTCVSVYDGGEFRAIGSSIRGFGNSVVVNSGGTAPNLIMDSISLQEDINSITIQHTGTTGYFNGVIDIKKTIIPEESSFYIYNENLKVLTVGKKGEQYNSVAQAVNTITDSSETNRYVVKISPGEYIEPLIDLSNKSYVSIVGESIQSVVIIPDGNHNIINIGVNCEISFLTLKDAPVGYSGLYCYDIGDFGQAHKLSFYDCDTSLHVESNTQDTIFYGEYLDYNGIYSYGTKVIANNGFLALANLENYYNFPTDTNTQINNYVTGSGGTLDIQSGSINGNGITGTTGIYLQHNATISIKSTNIDGLYYGIHNGNIGGGCDIKVVGVNTTNSELYDVFVEQPNTIGVIQGVFSHEKINSASSAINWLFLDSDDGEIDITNNLAVSFSDGSHTDLSTLLFETCTFGLLSGGEITYVSGLTVSVNTGFGYLINSNSFVNRVDWVTQNLVLNSGSTNYLFFNENGILSASGGRPSDINNINLGRVITSTVVDIIDLTPMDAEHTSNKYNNLFTEGLGAIYVNGSLVIENVTPFNLDITQGSYYYGSNNFLPTGGTQVMFTQYNRSGLTDWVTTGVTTVNNTQYDNGGTLTALTTSYYTKHTLYTVGDGIYEKYLLVLGQNEYSTLVAAEGASLPTPPNYFSNGIVQIASIYVREGDANIIQIEDIKPTVAFRTGGVNASSVHGNLQGLEVDDHTQYLLADGGRALSGNLNLGNNSIISANTINSVTIQTHASRHLPNGADPLTSGVPSNIGLTNQEGVANAFARLDHIHAHGNLTGGTTHNAATTSVNGFMSSTDKSYLDSVPSLLNTKANLSGATFTGTILAPTISATTYQGNVITSGTSVGGGEAIFKQKNGNNLEFKTLVAGNNITLTPSTDSITIDSTGGGGGSSRITGTTATTNASLTLLDTIDNIIDDSTNLIEVFITAYQASATQYGAWKRTLTVTKVSGTVTIREENADVDKQSNGLKATSVSFSVSGGNIDINVTGIAATTINWKSAYEIIL